MYDEVQRLLRGLDQREQLNARVLARRSALLKFIQDHPDEWVRGRVIVEWCRQTLKINLKTIKKDLSVLRQRGYIEKRMSKVGAIVADFPRMSAVVPPFTLASYRATRLALR